MISLQNKCQGAIVASAIGDALGWPNENRSGNMNHKSNDGDNFISWERRTGGRYWNHFETIHAGEYSDDTQMILAVARSIIAGDWNNCFAKNELPYWLKYERGGGSALKRAASALKNNKKPWESDPNQYFKAGGNGVVMRILPHVISNYNTGSVETLMNDIFKNSIITHGHPRAILGATCYAYALYSILSHNSILEYGELIDLVLEGSNIWCSLREDILLKNWQNSINIIPYNFNSIWNIHAMDMVEKLYFIKSSLQKGLLVNDSEVLRRLECFDKTNGAGDVAILTALYLASKYANSPALGVKIAAFTEGIDTDTIASITGGILGMLCGTEWIPESWKCVQDYNCLIDIANILFSINRKESSLQVTTKIKNQCEHWQSSPIGKLRKISYEELKSSKSSKVSVTKMETLLGQTLFIKNYERIKITENNLSNDTSKNNNIILRNDLMTELIINQKVIEGFNKSALFERVSFKKILHIFEMFFEGKYNSNQISKKVKVDLSIVEYIEKLLKDHECNSF